MLLIYIFVFFFIFFSMGLFFPIKTSLLLMDLGVISNLGDKRENLSKEIFNLMGIIGNPILNICKDSRISKISIRLKSASLCNLNVEQFYGLKLLCAIIGICIPMITKTSLLTLPIFFLLGYIGPEIWLNEKIKIRKKSIQKELPFALDLITISVEAGLNFENALSKVVQQGIRSPLTEEFSRVLKEIAIGRFRTEAMQEMALRVDHPDITSFVTTLIQAEELGTEIGSILRLLSEQARSKRSQRAEAAALKAPVKMLFPLTFLIFPTILLLLLGPPILRSLTG